MDFTFGIVTDGKSDHYIKLIISSIIRNNIPKYEIIIVGNSCIEQSDNIRLFTFDENIKPAWLNRKKNIISLNAKYDNIVILHDYVALEDNWYEGFLKYGDNFDWCITKVFNNYGQRFRDYTLFPYKVDYLNLNYCPGDDIDIYFNNNCLLPYDFINTIKTNKYMYISGSYWVIKKSTATKYLLDERLVWGQGEDVEYSKRLHENGIIIKLNPYSSVKFLKVKGSVYWEKEISPFYLDKFINYCNNT